MNRIVKSIVRIVLLVAGLYLAGIGYFAWNMRTLTDVDDYRDHLEKWNPRLVRHFPSRIEESRGDARFSYFPGFLQGGAHIQLRLSVSPQTVAETITEYSSVALHMVDLSAGEEIGQRTLDSIPYPPYYTHSNRETLDFPPRFTLYYRVAEPGTTAGFPWNHGETAGLAVSRQPPELVYWAESW